MPPELQSVIQISQLPISALLAIAVWRLYIDNKADREKAAAERAQLIDRLESVYRRVLSVQNGMGLNDPPTLPKKPTE